MFATGHMAANVEHWLFSRVAVAMRPHRSLYPDMSWSENSRSHDAPLTSALFHMFFFMHHFLSNGLSRRYTRPGRTQYTLHLACSPTFKDLKIPKGTVSDNLLYPLPDNVVDKLNAFCGLYGDFNGSV